MCLGYGKHQTLKHHTKQTLTWAYGPRWRPRRTPCCRDAQLSPPSPPLPAAASLPTKTDLAGQDRTALLLKHWWIPTEALRDTRSGSVAFGSSGGPAWSTPEIIRWNSRYEWNIPSLFGHLSDSFVHVSQHECIYFFRIKVFFAGGLCLTKGYGSVWTWA